MFMKNLTVECLLIYLLVYTVKSDFYKSEDANQRKTLNLNLSAAVNYIIKSVNASDVRIFGCSSYFQNDFKEISEHLKTHVSLELVNLERKYLILRKIPKNIFIIFFVDHYCFPFFKSFMESFGIKIRKHNIVIIFKVEYCDKNGSLVELSSFLWANKIINFVILRDCNMTIDVHSYFPFENGKCRKFSEANIIRIGVFNFNTSGEISFKLEYIVNANDYQNNPPNYLPFFSNKIPMKLNNCTIIVSTGIWPPSVIDVKSSAPGIEIDLILILAHHMNASISFVVDAVSWHGLAQGENEEHTGRLGLLKKEAFDMMLGSMPAHSNVFRDFDTSECYLPNLITFVVPTAKVFPSSMILLTMIEKHTNLFLVIVGIVIVLSVIIAFMTKITRKMDINSKHKNRFLQNVIATFLTLLRLLIETSTPALPQNRSIQWIYGMWFGTCLIISCYLNTKLTSFFTEPGRVKQLESVQDIIDSHIQIAIHELFYQVMAVDANEMNYFISKNSNTSQMMGLKLASLGQAVTYADKLRGEHIAVQWVSSTGEKPVKFIESGSHKYWKNIIFHTGNVFKDRINNLVKRINQSGYWEYQIRKYYNRRLIRIMIRQYLMVYNSHNDISNEELIRLLNKDYRDTIDSVTKTESLMVETNEQEIIDRFVRTDKTLVTWDHLSTVFRLWAIGLGTAGMVFVCERLFFFYRENVSSLQ